MIFKALGGKSTDGEMRPYEALKLSSNRLLNRCSKGLDLHQIDQNRIIGRVMIE